MRPGELLIPERHTRRPRVYLVTLQARHDAGPVTRGQQLTFEVEAPYSGEAELRARREWNVQVHGTPHAPYGLEGLPPALVSLYRKLVV